MQNPTNGTPAENILTNQHYSGLASVLHNLHRLAEPQLKHLSKRDRDLLESHCEAAIYSISNIQSTACIALFEMDNAEFATQQHGATEMLSLGETVKELQFITENLPIIPT